jgi:hypothetical protein
MSTTLCCHLAAVETLRHLLAQIRPLYSRELLLGQATRIKLAKMRFTLKHEVVLDELMRGKMGFALTLRTRIPEHLLTPNIKGKIMRRLRWQGVERIVDDLGHSYLVSYRLFEGGKRFPWWSSYSLQLICYPTIAPFATMITLTSRATSFVIQDGTEEQLLYLGDLTWPVKVTKMVLLEKS